MTTYGFVIDQNSCIGCHACTTACKSENRVPLGVFRTWVKYVEKGEFPNTRRHFLVERCNHCANAPCVTICPTQSMFMRRDGIVDFDPTRCIGCKACMQACPYDAIYIDPETETAAKCNYCAHRTEIGLQPACVIACPEEAIISWDLDDPNSKISQLLGRENLRQRRPDQGTQPKLWYIGAEEVAINPEFFSDPQGSMWAQHRALGVGGQRRGAREQRQPTDPRPLAPGQSVAAGFLAEAGQVGYNVAHEQPWGFLVAAYLWTKSIGAGAMLMLALLLGLGRALSDSFVLGCLLVALVFTGITTLLLVADLKHPERFILILTKPNFRSWLVWGAYILIAFSILAGLALIGAVLGLATIFLIGLWGGAALGVLAAGYSGFLFGQAEGRDFWQSPLLPVHLLAQAMVAGAAVAVLVGPALGSEVDVVSLLTVTLAIAVLGHLVLVTAEVCTPHANTHIKLAAATLVSGKLRRRFWGGAIALGIVLPLVVIAVTPLLAPLAAVAALAGLLFYEDAWVTAGQSVPMS